jgi:phosphatidylethanolamine-binding protein (PEBP) family uncharacterized protein
VAILGRLLMNRRAGETGLAWNQGSLAGPEILRVGSPAFADGGAMPRELAGRRAGGQNVSPALNWTEQPADTAQLLLFVEDVDAPTSKPFVHCVALLAPDVVGGELAAGALDREKPAAGVTLLRGQMGSGYRGPGPIKGHGPHRYVFQLFALGSPLPETVDGTPIAGVPARRIPTLVADGSLLVRGRLTGTYER